MVGFNNNEHFCRLWYRLIWKNNWNSVTLYDSYHCCAKKYFQYCWTFVSEMTRQYFYLPFWDASRFFCTHVGSSPPVYNLYCLSPILPGMPRGLEQSLHSQNHFLVEAWWNTCNKMAFCFTLSYPASNTLKCNIPLRSSSNRFWYVERKSTYICQIICTNFQSKSVNVCKRGNIHDFLDELVNSHQF